MKDRPLTIKQKLYLEGVLQGLSGVKACMKAGYKGNDNTLAQRAHELVRNSKVKAAIDKRRAEIEAKTEYTIEMWMKDVLSTLGKAKEKDDLHAEARQEDMLAKHIGGYEADKDHTATQLQVNIAAQQAQIDEYIALGRALDDAPDAMAK